MDEFQFLRNAFYRLGEAKRSDAKLAEFVATLPKKQQYLTNSHSLAVEYIIREYLEMKNEKARGRG